MIQLKLEANSKYYYYDPLEKLIIPNGYQLNENLQHQETQVSLRIAYDSELHKILVENQNIPAKLVDGDKILFTGTIDSGISWTDNGNPEPLDCFNITIFDNSGKLQATTESEFAMINKSLTEIIVAICDNCGIVCSRTNFPVDDPIVPVFILPAEKEFYQPLSDLLFEYGYAFGFDNNGYFGLINLTQPQSVTFNDDLYEGVKFSRTKKKYTGLSVTYGQFVQKNNEQVFFEGGDLDAENKILPIVIQPGAYYPWESDPIIEADEGQVFQQFATGFVEGKILYNGEKKYQRNNNSKLIYTTNHELVPDFSDNLTVDRKEFSFTQASIRFHNASTTDATLKQLAIRATAYYRQEQQIILGSGKKFEYQTNYLYDKEKTDDFVEILKKYFLGGNFKITFKTDTEFTPGTKTKLNTGLSGITADVLILSCDKDFDNENYTVNAITIQDISLDEKKYQTQKSMTADQLIQRTEYTTTSIKTIQEEYYQSTSRTELIGGTWQTTPPTPSTNTYIWTRTQFIYDDGTEVTTDPISVSGENGDNIESVDVEYAQNQSRTTAPTTGWQTTAPTSKDGYYTWSRTKIKLKNEDATYTDAVCITGDKGEQGVRGSLEFSGTEINAISDITEAIYTITTASTGITSATMPILVGDTYINITTQDVWICSTAGTPTTAKWKYQGRRCSDKDDSNRFRMFTPATDNGSMQSTLTKQVVKGENPFGKIDDLLKITNSNGTAMSKYTPYNKRTKIDPKKTYRHVTYIKQEDANYIDYIGIASWESENSYCLSLSGSPINSAYFVGTNNLGTLGRWYMIVGYVVANGTTTAPADSGVYDMVTKQKVRGVTNYQWKPNVKYCNNSGCLIRYTGNALTKTGTAYLYDVRLDEVNGTEPTLNELLDISRGKYYGYEKPAVPFKNDTYLDTTTGYLYEYDGVKWVAITDVSDSRYNQAINDMIAFATNNPTLPFLTARNAWIERLAVDGLLANKIATQELKIRDGGIIHSDNYDGTVENGVITESGTEGWAIDYNGTAEFMGNIKIGNNSFFGGEIENPVIKCKKQSFEKVLRSYNPTTTTNWTGVLSCIKYFGGLLKGYVNSSLKYSFDEIVEGYKITTHSGAREVYRITGDYYLERASSGHIFFYDKDNVVLDSCSFFASAAVITQPLSSLVTVAIQKENDYTLNITLTDNRVNSLSEKTFFEYDGLLQRGGQNPLIKKSFSPFDEKKDVFRELYNEFLLRGDNSLFDSHAEIRRPCFGFYSVHGITMMIITETQITFLNNGNNSILKVNATNTDTLNYKLVMMTLL